MRGVLDAVDWGDSSRSLLRTCNHMKNMPAVMIVRHSEVDYESINIISQRRDALLTHRGKEAAFDFGTQLPTNREYRLYHSNRQRTKETAEYIQQGLTSRGCNPEMKGEMAFLTSPSHDQDQFSQHLARELDRENGLWNFFINWLSERYPPWEIEPSKAIAQRIAYGVMKNLQSCPSNGFDIYVAHDATVLLLMFHWFGQLNPSRVDFLDGVTVQFQPDTMLISSKHGTSETWYPYWLNALRHQRL